MDLDEPVNVDMEPEDALKVLLGTEPPADGDENDEDDTDDE